MDWHPIQMKLEYSTDTRKSLHWARRRFYLSLRCQSECVQYKMVFNNFLMTRAKVEDTFSAFRLLEKSH